MRTRPRYRQGSPHSTDDRTLVHRSTGFKLIVIKTGILETQV
jgi:hypothetical protein